MLVYFYKLIQKLVLSQQISSKRKKNCRNVASKSLTIAIAITIGSYYNFDRRKLIFIKREIWWYIQILLVQIRIRGIIVQVLHSQPSWCDHYHYFDPLINILLYFSVFLIIKISSYVTFCTTIKILYYIQRISVITILFHGFNTVVLPLVSSICTDVSRWLMYFFNFELFFRQL